MCRLAEETSEFDRQVRFLQPMAAQPPCRFSSSWQEANAVAAARMAAAASVRYYIPAAATAAAVDPRGVFPHASPQHFHRGQAAAFIAHPHQPCLFGTPPMAFLCQPLIYHPTPFIQLPSAAAAAAYTHAYEPIALNDGRLT